MLEEMKRHMYTKKNMFAINLPLIILLAGRLFNASNTASINSGIHSHRFSKYKQTIIENAARMDLHDKIKITVLYEIICSPSSVFISTQEMVLSTETKLNGTKFSLKTNTLITKLSSYVSKKGIITLICVFRNGSKHLSAYKLWNSKFTSHRFA